VAVSQDLLLEFPCIGGTLFLSFQSFNFFIKDQIAIFEEIL